VDIHIPPVGVTIIAMNSSPSKGRRAKSHTAWLLALPKLGIVLLLAALFSLLWLLHKNEISEERNSLIKDVLWLEQNLRFHLSGVST
jgi:two-component system sensor histidine kinase DctS